MSRCPRCSAILETPLGCLACGVLLPLEPQARNPDPFETFGLATAYPIDLEELRNRLLRFSRMTHPDFFAIATPEEKQRAERATATLNASYAVLSDDAERADHLIRSLGGPDESGERSMPKEFLMEVLEWNETLEEARGDGGFPAERLRALRQDLEARRAEALRAVDGFLVPLPARAAKELSEARRALNVVRYVDRALGELESLRLSRTEAR